MLHGGGNTSVKTRMADVTGQPLDVLCVKGSGWDMGTIEAPGLPAVRLAPLRELEGLQALSDEDMVNVQRANLLDSKAPNPSVETLLHAFLPHKFIDHTHSNAVLALTDQPDGAAAVPPISTASARRWCPTSCRALRWPRRPPRSPRRIPTSKGLILLKHGIFSMGATAEEAYVRMIDLVTMAEQRLAKATRKIFPGATLPGEDRDRGGDCADPARPVSRCRQRPAAAKPRSASCSSSAASPEILAYRERQGDRALQPARPGDTRPRDPHQERGRSSRRRRMRASSMRSAAPRPTLRHVSSPTITPTSPRYNGEQIAEQERARSHAARRAGARVSACSASATRRRTPRSRPTSPRRRSR